MLILLNRICKTTSPSSKSFIKRNLLDSSKCSNNNSHSSNNNNLLKLICNNSSRSNLSMHSKITNSHSSSSSSNSSSNSNSSNLKQNLPFTHLQYSSNPFQMIQQQRSLLLISKLQSCKGNSIQISAFPKFRSWIARNLSIS